MRRMYYIPRFRVARTGPGCPLARRPRHACSDKTGTSWRARVPLHSSGNNGLTPPRQRGKGGEGKLIVG
ncbi:hypothetical protein PUN28_009526 [Cardiocondyla obscurior]|uniref:Uncharacterized protein n=1 Tax=Cardiocondyla obscurior TaxID=286306 RepID=A0AAW2FY57_9HYME